MIVAAIVSYLAFKIIQICISSRLDDCNLIQQFYTKIIRRGSKMGLMLCNYLIDSIHTQQKYKNKVYKNKVYKNKVAKKNRLRKLKKNKPLPV
jgi:hypothetical protein